MKITAENMIEQAEAFRTEGNGNTLLDYFDEQMGVNEDRVKEVTGCDLSKPITTPEEALLFAKMCQMAWSGLPDRSSIRVYPFFKLCDFAEFWCEEGCVLLAEPGPELS